jgi:hypothetical protein
MASPFEVDGGEQFRAAAKRLRAAGDKELTKELYRALNVGAEPMKESIRKNFATKLPRGGGRGRRATRKLKGGGVSKGRLRAPESLAARAASAGISVKGRAGRNPAVYVTAKTSSGKTIDLKALDAGYVRHPTFGHDPWRVQAVTPNTFTDGVEEKLPGVQKEILKALDNITAMLSGRGM